ncbi:MAG: ATP-binding protein, partial [Thermoplasmata archaeon]
MLLGRLPRVLAARPGTALLVKGGPGVGKTEVVMDFYRQASEFVVTKFVAAQETPESVTGFLWIDKETGSCKYLPQRRLRDINEEIKAGKRGIVIIDEFKGGDRMTHNSLQQLIREHEVGDWIAAGYLYVVALTNREEDRANVVRLTAPMINRFEQITVEPDFDFWRSWASTRGMMKDPKREHPRIHPDILGWLSAVFIGGAKLKSEKAKEWAKDKSLLFCSPAPKGEEAFPTPRSHEVASDILYKFPGEDEDFLREMLMGCIGDGPAFEYVAWHKVGKEAQEHVESVVNGKSIPALDVGMQFFVNSSLTSRYAQDTDKVAGPLTKYLSEMESEYAMLLINDLAQISDKI